ncbi:MAG: D-alanyl-D-alanine carboxypeptidase [Clostridia bacterium]|nr:D-alanyl-D-alanine carboxypeptidase [Clostridia bacterium]
MKKRILLFLGFTILILTFFAFSVSAEEDMPDLSGVQNVFVYNIENDKTLYAKNETDRIYPASTAKIMTGVMAVELYRDNLSDLITVTQEALGNYKGKNIKLKAGEVVSIENLIYAVIVGGANDAAYVLAYEMSGSHELFIDNMNQKAIELGMKNTKYTNPSGYPDSEMYTTAEDTAILAKYAYHVTDYMEICSSARYVFPETNMSKTRYIYNSNYLIATNIETKYKNKEVEGMNAGSTVEGGHVVVTAVKKEGMTNIFVLMGGSYDDENVYSYIAANELIDWAFENFEYKKILDSGEMVCEIDVNLSGQVDYVVLSPAKTIEYFLPSSVDIKKDIVRDVELYKNSLNAPIPEGYIAGRITLSYDGKVISEVDLVTKNSVERNSLLYILARIKDFTSSPKFKIVIVCVVAAVVLYFAIAIYNRTRSKRYRYKYRKNGRR